VPLGLTGQEWGVLVVSIGPVVLTVLIVWLVWRWGKRSDAEEEEQRRSSGDGEGG
jgi:hypothetical protein